MHEQTYTKEPKKAYPVDQQKLPTRLNRDIGHVQIRFGY